MRTTISHITVTEIDDSGREHESLVRIRTKDEELMANRVIQILSQCPKGRVKIELSLILEAYQAFSFQLAEGVFAVVASRYDDIDKEFCDAVFGLKREAKEPYRSFAKNQILDTMNGIINGTDSRPIMMEHQAKLFGEFEEDKIILLEQMLRARRRLKRFNSRHNSEEMSISVPYTESVEEIFKRIEGHMSK